MMLKHRVLCSLNEVISQGLREFFHAQLGDRLASRHLGDACACLPREYFRIYNWASRACILYVLEGRQGHINFGQKLKSQRSFGRSKRKGKVELRDRQFYVFCTVNCYTECPTTYQTRQFFNNFTTNEDIATKFEADLPHCVRNMTKSYHVVEVATICVQTGLNPARYILESPCQYVRCHCLNFFGDVCFQGLYDSWFVLVNSPF